MSAKREFFGFIMMLVVAIAVSGCNNDKTQIPADVPHVKVSRSQVYPGQWVPIPEDSGGRGFVMQKILVEFIAGAKPATMVFCWGNDVDLDGVVDKTTQQTSMTGPGYDEWADIHARQANKTIFVDMYAVSGEGLDDVYGSDHLQAGRAVVEVNTFGVPDSFEIYLTPLVERGIGWTNRSSPHA